MSKEKLIICTLLLVLMPFHAISRVFEPVIVEPSVSYPSLRQDSVKTTIIGTKSITTFYVYAPESNNYIIKFWLMGVKHADGEYSIYHLRIDQNQSENEVHTTVGDWRLCDIYNTDLVYLTQGFHQLHLEGTCSDIPNSERVICRRSLSHNVQQTLTSENARYSYLKQHQQIPGGIELVGVGSYKRLDCFSSDWPDLSPWFTYTAELNKDVYYSFHRLEYYVAGQVVTFQTDVIDGIKHVLHVFSKCNDGQYHASAVSNDNHATLNYVVPVTGFYYVLVRSYNSSEYGKCNLSINGNNFFENIPVCCSYTGIELPDDNIVYSSFAKSSTGDPFILLLNSGNGGGVVAYNDDYPYNSSLSDYDWKKNARIDRCLSEGQWLFATTESYPAWQAHKLDIYTRCELLDIAEFCDSFPNYKQKDILDSDDYGDYNCIAWSVGEWTEWFWPEDIHGNTTIEAFDSLYNAYGYTRIGATEDNSVIDLWGGIYINDSRNFTHASVKSKGHDYAAGYEWESKLGGSYRVFHPRYALEGPYYENVVYHYKKIHNGDWHYPILLNIEVTPEEYEQIERNASSVPEETITSFDNMYTLCQKEGILKISISLDEYESIKSYNNLLEFCICNPVVTPLIHKRILQKEPLAIKLLKDISKRYDSTLWLKIISETSKMCKSDGDYKIVCPLQAKALLLLKAMLQMPKMDIELSRLANDAKSFSSDSAFDLQFKDNLLVVSFILNNDAYISLGVGEVGSSNINTFIDRKNHSKGYHQIEIPIRRSGIYGISLSVNGCVYKKKIQVSIK